MAPKRTRQVEDDLQEDESEDCSRDEFEHESDNPPEDDSRQEDYDYIKIVKYIKIKNIAYLLVL